MKKVTKILLIGIIILVLTFFLYIIPKNLVIKVDEKDFDILKIEYTKIYNSEYDNETHGYVKLSIQTRRDNLIISASSKTNKARLGCAREFETAGFHTLEGCTGDPSYGFEAFPINQEHNFTVCAFVSWSLLYKREPSCKSIILPPYQNTTVD